MTATFSGGNYVRLYVNGEQVCEGTTNVPPTLYSPSGLNLGYAGSYTGWYWPGSTDDLRIYNRVLTDSEISQLYNGGAGTEAE